MKTTYISYIEYIFYNERLIREAVTEAREYRPYHLIRNDSGIGDPTASAVINELTPLKTVAIAGREVKHPERWLEVIDKTRTYCGKRGAIHLATFESRYSGEKYYHTCARLHISPAVYYEVVDQIRHYAALQAAERRIIHVE